MGKINVGRVILGGLLAGLVVNIGEAILNLGIVARDMETALRDRNLPPVSGSAIGVLICVSFLLGIVAVWTYAVARPRLGPGVRTAVIVGVAVWFLAAAYGNVGIALVGILPASLTTVITLWALLEIVLGTVAGAWVYRE